MPLFYQHNINEATKLGVWRIEETEDYFLSKVPLQKQVSHPYKKLQHLAGRYLLPVLYGDFPLEEIIIADTQRPFLENSRYHFSISHSGNQVAAIVSSKNRVGVDLELITPRIKNIADKFLSPTEKESIGNFAEIPQVQLELITLYWCAKEAIFKWFGKGELDFKGHIEILSSSFGGSTGTLDCLFKKGETAKLAVSYHLFGGFVVAWVCT